MIFGRTIPLTHLCCDGGACLISVHQRFPHAWSRDEPLLFSVSVLYGTRGRVETCHVVLKGFESRFLSPSWNVVSTWRRLQFWTCCLICIYKCAHLLIHGVCTRAFNLTPFWDVLHSSVCRWPFSPSIYLSLSIFPSACLSMPVYLSVYLSFCLSVCPSVYPFSVCIRC